MLENLLEMRDGTGRPACFAFHLSQAQEDRGVIRIPLELFFEGGAFMRGVRRRQAIQGE